VLNHDGKNGIILPRGVVTNFGAHWKGFGPETQLIPGAEVVYLA